MVTNWQKKVNVHEALNSENGLTLEQRARQIHDTLENAGLFDWYGGVHLKARAEELVRIAQMFPNDPDYFDVPLGRIYDWCDARRVWLESRTPPAEAKEVE